MYTINAAVQRIACSPWIEHLGRDLENVRWHSGSGRVLMSGEYCLYNQTQILRPTMSWHLYVLPETQEQTFKLSAAQKNFLPVSQIQTERITDLDEKMEKFDIIEIYSCFKSETTCCLQLSNLGHCKWFLVGPKIWIDSHIYLLRGNILSPAGCYSDVSCQAQIMSKCLGINHVFSEALSLSLI